MTSQATDAIVNLSQLPLNWLRHGERFEVGLNDIDKALGLTGLGATFSVAGRLSPLDYWEGEDARSRHG